MNDEEKVGLIKGVLRIVKSPSEVVRLIKEIVEVGTTGVSVSLNKFCTFDTTNAHSDVKYSDAIAWYGESIDD